MKRLKLVFLLVAVLALLSVVTAFAGTAYNASFTTSITYQNVGSADATVVFQFFPENNGTAISIEKSLPEGAGSSLYVGSITEISAGFNGSALMSSDQPVVATLVQISSDPDVKNRPLSNGFESGAPEVLLATVLKNKFDTSSVFSVQNASNTPVDLTIQFYNAENPAAAPISIGHSGLPVGAAKYFDMGDITQVSASVFNGSAIVSAVESGTTNPADIVASVLELSTTGADASAFEGVTGGANTVYMPSALCQAFGATSAYAVQNTSQSSSANVTVAYSNGVSENATIAAGTKRSFIGCNATGMPTGFSGSATITSTGAPIVVIGKVFGSGNSTAFLGATEGYSTLALPYVRFTETGWASGERQRAYIAVQNVGAPIAAGQVVLHYLDRNGVEVGTHTISQAIATGEKVNSFARNPAVVGNAADLTEFGYIGGFGGSVIVEGPTGSELVAVVRIQSVFGAGVVGEDYNGIGIAP